MGNARAATLVPALVLALACPALADEKAQAQAHFAKGTRHYDLAEWDQAVEEFRAAYQLTGAPGLLYNIGQAYRKKGDCKQAKEFYTTYLRRVPEAENRAEVEEFIAEMEKCLAEGSSAPPPPPSPEPAPVAAPAPAPPPVAPPAPPPAGAPDRPPGSGLRVTALVAAASGVALAGAGVYFSLRVRDANHEVMDLAAQGGAWTGEEVERRAQRDQVIAAVLYAAAGAAIVTGGILYVVDRGRRARLTGAVSPGGVSLGLACGF